MKRNSYQYRKIWTETYGEIPKDSVGRSYEIHHINGDRSDNSLSNLACVSLYEHFRIHYLQGEYKACRLIAFRMNNPALGRKMSEMARAKMSEVQKQKVLDGSHHLLSGEIQSRSNAERVKNGTHNFQDRVAASIRNKKMVLEGTHPLLKNEDGTSIGAASTRDRISKNLHHFQDSVLQSELSQRAKMVNQKPVLQIDDGAVVEYYPSVKHVLEKFPSYTSNMYRVIAAGRKFDGFLWVYADMFNDYPVRE